MQGRGHWEAPKKEHFGLCHSLGQWLFAPSCVDKSKGQSPGHCFVEFPEFIEGP